MFSQRNETELRATLHIANVTEEDYDAEYVCWMANMFGITSRNVILQRPEKTGVTY